MDDEENERRKLRRPQLLMLFLLMFLMLFAVELVAVATWLLMKEMALIGLCKCRCKCRGLFLLWSINGSDLDVAVDVAADLDAESDLNNTDDLDADTVDLNNGAEYEWIEANANVVAAVVVVALAANNNVHE